jgi:hypothetical protein|tara:strand:+ start:274 stop:594 length:321 start_codon:yes stop_codon:yes gene_type:complete
MIQKRYIKQKGNRMTVKIDRAYPLKDHRVGLKEHSYQGIIKVGDTITTSNGREGKIKTITIATHENDVAGESGTDVLSYNTKLEYQGNVSYGDGYWTYFNAILRVA